MTIEKLKSGSYRIKQMYKGKYYSCVIDHKPTQKEAIKLLAEAMDNVKEDKVEHLTFEKAAVKYCESKKNSLSISTYRGYMSNLRSLPDDFKSKFIDDITQDDIQNLANEYLKDKKVKYVKNLIGFIRSVLGYFRADFKFRITYPSVTENDRNEPYIPTVDEVESIFIASEGTMYEIPVKLAAMCGLRRGEIVALQIDDLSDDNILTIDKDMEQDNDNNWIVRPPKNKGSIRKVYVPDELADKIRAQGYIYKGYPNSIYDWLNDTEKRLGIEHFSLHKLRHFFCSRLAENGIDEATILKLGGWSDPSIMKRVYRHSSIDRDIDRMKSASSVIMKK